MARRSTPTIRRIAATLLVAAAALAGGPAGAASQSFESWVAALRQEARGRGISAATLDAALAGVRPIPRVIELDRKQPEFTLTFQQYVERVVPQGRIDKGRQLLAENRALLETISRKYGVPARYIVALWGVETDFGRITGGFPVIAALATLAYDGRRSAFFRTELLHALRIVEDGHIDAKAMIGSWAGAMGQSQFMPSSFVAYAVDHNGDGRRDIWGTKADVFASIANYLSRSGWNEEQTWGRAVQLPDGFDRRLADGRTRKPLEAWRDLGVRRADGGELPRRDLRAALVLPTDSMTPAYLAYDNFEVILKWNRSTYFAIAVGRLADALKER